LLHKAKLFYMNCACYYDTMYNDTIWFCSAPFNNPVFYVGVTIGLFHPAAAASSYARKEVKTGSIYAYKFTKMKAEEHEKEIKHILKYGTAFCMHS
jgi:hypothetical protein